MHDTYNNINGWTVFACLFKRANLWNYQSELDKFSLHKIARLVPVFLCTFLVLRERSRGQS